MRNSPATKSLKISEKIILTPISALIGYEKNARTHSDEQVDQIAASILEFGFTNPILVDSKHGVIAGHGRLEAAKKLNLKEVPTIVLDHLTDLQKRAYILADNKLALNAGWDEKILGEELADLLLEGYDVDLVGFTSKELQELLPDDDSENNKDADLIPEVPQNILGVKLGDVYQLGKHRLMCGDSTDLQTVERLMNGEKVDMVFTDPPYGIDLNTDYTSLKSKRVANKFERVANDSKQFDPSFLLNLADEVLFFGANYMTKFYDPNKGSWIMWDKRNDNENLDKMYGSSFEMCWSKKKRKQEIARITWAGCFGHNKNDDGAKKTHPTMKPIKLIEWFFERIPALTVLDLFGGSGSTLIACEKTNRKCFMMELDPHYCSVIIKRWEIFTGKKAKKITSKVIVKKKKK